MEETPQEETPRSTFVREHLALVFAGALVLYVLSGFGLGWFLDWYIDPAEAATPSTAKKDLVQAVAFVLAGLAGIIGVYFTWRNLNQTRDNTEEQLKQAREAQAETYASTQQTLILTRKGQITDRFTRAIDQLGNDKPEVRIGSIYALESIARESKQHYWPIVEVVTAYVRTRTSLSPEEGPKFVGYLKPVKDRTHRHGSADVQAALYVLANRNHAWDPGEDKFINLSSTDLRNADLRGAHLEKARLRRTNLTKAILRKTNFQGAKLTGATLNGAKLDPANFEEADLGGAHLEKADLVGADLKQAHVDKADLKRADLKRADLRSSNLERADLRGADLSEAKFGQSPANDSTTVLRGANLTGAIGVDVSQLEATGVQLEGATMPDGSKHP